MTLVRPVKKLGLSPGYRDLHHQPSSVSEGMPMGVKKPLWMGLPVRIKQMRLRLGWSQRQISLRAGCSVGMVWDIEAGQVPRIDTVERLAIAMGVPPCWLAFGHQGEEVFRPHRPRDPLPPDMPEPQPLAETSVARYRGCAGRLRSRRQALSISLRSLGEVAYQFLVPMEHYVAPRSLSGQTISNTESGHTVPRLDTVEALARALGVTPCWLAYGVGEESDATVVPGAPSEPAA